jgi:protocatechuate 3,4-dioxygenase beta subunit
VSTVLERNVRLLLQRSYVPALPAPPFRDRLEALFLNEVARHAERRGPKLVRARPGGARVGPFRLGPSRLGPVRLVLALAAAVLAAFLGWRLFVRAELDPRARLLAAGEVALRAEGGAWRAASAAERRDGLALAAETRAVWVATPAGAELELHLSAGSLFVGERSELELARSADALVATLQAGSAWLAQGAERVELVPRTPRALAAPPGATSTSTPATGIAQAPAREAVPAVAPPLAQPPPEATRTLLGRVRAPAGAATPPNVSVALLAERRGNATPPPLVRELALVDGAFRWPDPPSGKQRVFVHAPGYALCALGEHELSGALPELVATLEVGESVRGSVLDEAGNPVPNALVLSENEIASDGLLFAHAEAALAFWLPIQARTGADGRFELAHLGAGTHALRADAPGFAPSWKDGVRVPREVEARAEELVLRLGRGGAIEGRVTRADGGPWAEAELVVVAMNDGDRPLTTFGLARTAADGTYRIEHLPPTTLIVVVMSRDSTTAMERPEVRPVQIVAGASVRADFPAPQRGIRLHGRLLDAEGAPLAQRNLGLFDAESASWNQDWVATTTHSDGAFAFEGVEPGRYFLFAIGDVGQDLTCIDELELGPGASDVERELRLARGRLAVQIFEAETAAPVARAALILMRVSDAGRTDFAGFGMSADDGRFEFAALRPGRHYVVAYPTVPGLAFGESARVDLDEGAPIALEIGLEPGGSVDVVVRDAEGRGLEGAVVVFLDEREGEHLFARLPQTDARGRFQAHGLAPGLYRVRAEKPGYQGTPVEFRFELGRELEVPLVLAPMPPR